MKHSAGTWLRADMTERSLERCSLDHEKLQGWIGGRGLAGCFLMPSATLEWDDPDMPLIFMTGPLAGTRAPTSGRMCVMSRSPLTGTVGDCSVGGSLAHQLAAAGYRGIVVTGKSGSPLGLCIDGDGARLEDASGLAGRDTDELHGLLSDRGAVAVVGPAALNGVLFANIMVDGCHTAGRNGLGRVMAGKNLVFLTVKGYGTPAVADGQGLDAACEEIRRLMASSPVIMGEFGLRNMGTPALYDLMHSRGMMPTANFRRTSFEEAPSMNACALRDAYSPSRTGCRGCHVLCKKVRRSDSTHMPEFETLSHFSALLENRDLGTVVEANAICNRAGMDTITAGSTLACYAEIEGRRLAPGEILGLLREISLGRGEGWRLGSGSWRYAADRGVPEASVTVKKLELPAYDPRGACGMALAYAVSTRGGCHLRAYPISHEILRKPVVTDRLSFSGKARIVKIAEDANAAIDSLSVCKFSFFGASLEEYARACSAVTGSEVSAQDLVGCGERIVYRERIMNAMNGFDSTDDDLPARFFLSPGSSGVWGETPAIDRSGFLEARSRYYRIRGLDGDGRPTPDMTRELGL
jgi:aldehyde:ferredoxin oxidoreductase